MSIKLIFASTAALALIAGAPVHAAKNESSRAMAAADSGAGAKAKEERKTCRLYDNSVSRMKRERICMTREEWKKFEEAQKEM